MSIKLSYKPVSILLLLLLFSIGNICCKSAPKEEPTAEQIEAKKKRELAGLRLGAMLNARNFEQALQYIDSLHREYPNDPQFYFAEGWVYEMQGDSIRERKAYIKSCEIYDSLISVKPNSSDMINRALIVQILYGMEAYNQALDEMLSTLKSPKDSLEIEQMWRGMVFKEKEISF